MRLFLIIALFIVSSNLYAITMRGFGNYINNTDLVGYPLECTFEPQLGSFDTLFDCIKITLDETNNNLNGCGLRLVQYAYTHAPQYEIVNLRNTILALLNQERYYSENIYVYKNPDSSQPHYIGYSKDMLRFITPIAGTVATVHRTTGIDGVAMYDFTCKNVPVDLRGFQECIYFNFVAVISGQLCRYAN